MNSMTSTRPINECRVLCTPKTFGKKDPSLISVLETTVREVIYNPFDRPLKSADLLPLVRDVDGYIAGLDEVDEHVLEAANRLRVIARYGVGYDQIAIGKANSLGIVITNTPGANSVAVAELTIAFILSLARNILVANEAVHRGEWPKLDGVGIRAKTVGLVGFGSVGREVAQRLKGFGCNILAYDPYVEQETVEELGVKLVPLEELVTEADFVSLHAPATESSKGMVNKEFLGNMKRGSFLINTARGDLVDEQALILALENGHLQGAALDCFSSEPPDKSNRLLGLSQVIVTPHYAAHTDEAMNQMGWASLNDCLAVLRGEPPVHIVNPEVLGTCSQKENNVRS